MNVKISTLLFEIIMIGKQFENNRTVISFLLDLLEPEGVKRLVITCDQVSDISVIN